MALIDVGPDITKQTINSAITQMISTIDLLKEREQAISGLLGQAADADLVALGYTQAEVSYIRAGIGALDALVTQGLANATIKAFTDRGRNFGQ